jgi:dTDP-4-amino-4,6-dideoxygalactose transaminase
MQINVPFLDLKTHHAPLLEEFDAAIREVIDSSAFAGGPFVAQFEEDFAAFCKSRHAIGVGNGTDALWLALLATGVGPGDEVITVPTTFLATAEAITYAGAKPVFVDVDPKTYTMDPAGLEEAVTARTKAIMPVHIFGQTADMDPICAFARDRGLFVIEDAAQAHGALYKGKEVGALGDAACVSFYPGKNLGALGEAGAVVTNHSEIRDKVRVLRDHGQTRKYHHTMVGWNGRMDGIQGAVLSIKLRHLEKWNELRRSHAAYYDAGFAGIEEIVTPFVRPDSKSVYHVYAVRVQNRDEVIRFLAERGIGSGVHYPIPVHLQEAYAHLGHGIGDFPVAERCATEFLSLPMFPELSIEQLARVVQGVKEAVQATAGKSSPQLQFAQPVQSV